jgi:hypothetical protein
MLIERSFKKVSGQLVYRHPVNGVSIILRRVMDGTLVEWTDRTGKAHRKTIFGGYKKAESWVSNHIDEEGELQSE